MAWGDNSSKFREEEPLWCLVEDNRDSASVTLMAETKLARQDRHDGNAPSDRKETLMELDDDINRFINRNRLDCKHEVLLKLVSAVSLESAKLEAAKPRETKTTSSVL